MTAHAGSKAIRTRLVQVFVLVSLFVVLLAATHVVPVLDSHAGTISAIGFLLLTGTLTSELVEVVRLPHLSGYLLAGIVAGPHVLHLIDEHTVGQLTRINALALALIALEGGAELRMEALVKGLKSLGVTTVVQSTLVLVVMTAVFVAARPLIPFVQDLSPTALVGVGLLWGTVAVSRSPSATLAILSQTRASGPLTQNTLTFVMVSDVVVAVLMAAMLVIARPLITPASSFSMRELQQLGHELLGSVALGTTLGLVLAAYIRLVGKQLTLVFVALGFGMTEMLHYLRFDALLTFMVAGFVVQNLSRQGERFIKGTSETASIVFVVFFATAGAHLDVPLLRLLWPVALLLAGTRALATVVAARIAARAAGDSPLVKRWSWAGLISQAGLTLGLCAVVERVFPSFGPGFRSLAIATIALNEMVGPVFFKLALDKTGETSQRPHRSLSTLSEGAPEAEG